MIASIKASDASRIAVLGDLGSVTRRLPAGPGMGSSVAALVLLREVDPFCAMIADPGAYVVKK